MYRWYGKADVSYAYLSDVDVDISPEPFPSTTVLRKTQRTIDFKLDHMDDYQRGQHEHTRRFPPKQAQSEMAAELMDVEKSWKSCYEATETLPAAFKQSKWFTRDWTLQELLAPKEVLFLNRQWMHFDTKSALADEIETFTGIRETTLRYARGSCGLKYVSLAQKLCLGLYANDQ